MCDFLGICPKASSRKSSRLKESSYDSPGVIVNLRDTSESIDSGKPEIKKSKNRLRMSLDSQYNDLKQSAHFR